jgi:hypothetical protein
MAVPNHDASILLANSELASFCDIAATKKQPQRSGIHLNCPTNHEENRWDNLKVSH